MKAWITKYALTQGIYEIDAEDCGGGMIADKSTTWATYFHGEGRDWCSTKQAAIKRAEEMRAARIASLNKSIEKLKRITFA